MKRENLEKGGLYSQWVDACMQVGIPVITPDTAARLMAVVYEYGNNEYLTLSQKFLADVKYIQQRFHIHGCGIVDAEFRELLKGYVKELQDYQQEHEKDEADKAHSYRAIAPDWAPQLLKDRYNIKFIG